jgi:hypothetical protein
MRDFDQQLLRLKAAVGLTSDQAVAAVLGMTKAAFSDRKKRGAFPEDRLRALAQRRPELLLDVEYVLTGRQLHEETAVRNAVIMAAAQRQLGLADPGSNGPTSAHLTVAEQELLRLYRSASLTQQIEAVAALGGNIKKPRAKPKAPSESAGIKVSGRGNKVAGRDFNERKE